MQIITNLKHFKDVKVNLSAKKFHYIFVTKSFVFHLFLLIIIYVAFQCILLFSRIYIIVAVPFFIIIMTLNVCMKKIEEGTQKKEWKDLIILVLLLLFVAVSFYTPHSVYLLIPQAKSSTHFKINLILILECTAW